MKSDALWAWKSFLRGHNPILYDLEIVAGVDETADPFAVRLEANTYSIRWHSVVSRETKDAGTVEVEDGGNTTFTVPFAEAGPAVLHLRQMETEVRQLLSSAAP
jgi:hypothetical protein